MTAARIRPEAVEDHEAIRRVVASAFGSDLEARLVEAIRTSPEYLPRLALVAEVDGEIVGHVMMSIAAVDDGSIKYPIFQLAPLAVAPTEQRKGIGGALVAAVLERARAEGAEFVVLQGDPRYYGRLGFEPADTYGITMDLPDWAPPEAAQIRVLAEHPPRVHGHVVLPVAFDLVEQQ